MPQTRHNVERFELNRRAFLRTAGGIGMAGTAGLLASCRREDSPLLDAAAPPPRLVRFPKKAELILLTDRPPQLETPLHYFQQDLTPNEAFFVRWHLEGIPTAVDLRTFRLRVTGHVQKSLELSVDDLRTKFAPQSIVAVNQCSGNARSLYTPRIPGGQWGMGAMGNALWTGVRLKDVLSAAGVLPGSVDVSFNGLDVPPLQSMPDFVKSLAIAHALDGEVLIAYEMNGAPLPLLNGFPIRLIVPGWYATYWVKALSDIEVLPKKFEGFWMKKAYRVPNNPHGLETPDHHATDTIPINRLSVHSVFVRPETDQRLPIGQPCALEGLAMDSGSGIRRVEVSTDNGARWADAQLDPEIGRYSWRRWRIDWTPSSRGSYRLLVRATNRAGDTQLPAQWNTGGYMRDVIEHRNITVV